MWLVFALAAPAFFGATNVFDSLFMKRYEKNPVVYLCYAGVLMWIPLLLFPLFVDVRSGWMGMMLIAAFVAYIGELYYFYVLGRIDVSVVNACWAVLTILVSVGGYLLFAERWSLLQTVGTSLILGGIFFLSYWHRHVSMLRTICLFCIVGILLLPMILVQKAALEQGEGVLPITYWSLAGRNVPNVVVPLFRAEWRSGVRSLYRRTGVDFLLLVSSAILVWFLGVYCSIRAFELGYVSLVQTVGNVQPFFVILFAWIVARFIPAYAPRELFTAQSVQVKLVSFAVVFTGLAFLALS